MLFTGVFFDKALSTVLAAARASTPALQQWAKERVLTEAAPDAAAKHAALKSVYQQQRLAGLDFYPDDADMGADLDARSGYCLVANAYPNACAFLSTPHVLHL